MKLEDYGSVIWLTGLSGAGKSTLSALVLNALREDMIPTIMLDGDELRDVVRDTNCGHDYDSRLLNAYRMSRLAKLIAKQGYCVVVATMSMFHQIHAWNKTHLPQYFEVFVDVDISTARRRDPKGIYSENAGNIVGIDIKPEFPLHPHLTINNNADAVDLYWQANQIKQSFYLNSDFVLAP